MTSKCCGERAVIVAVYTERVPLSHHHHLQHHWHDNFHRRRRKGYNRKAELLEYARHLRASAQQHQTSHIKPLSTVNQVHIAAADTKAKRSGPPTCLGKWEFLVPNFVRSHKDKMKHKNSVSAATKMKVLVKSIQVQERTSFLSKLLRKLRNPR